MARGGIIWFIRVFALLYLLALGLMLVGMFGLFGQEKDALSAIFLIPLGLPWVLLTFGAPDGVLPWIGTLAPLLNLAILFLLWRARKDHKGQHVD